MNSILWCLAQNTVTVLVMIPFVLVACRFLRHRPAVQHVLWLVVVLKFVTPPLVVWPWTVEHVRDAIWPSPAPAPITAEVAQEKPAPEIVIPGEFEDKIGAERIGLLLSLMAKNPQPQVIDVEAVDPVVLPAAPADEGPGTMEIAVRLAAIAWAASAAVCLLWQLRRIARHGSLVRRGGAPTEPLTNEVQAIARQLGVKPPRTLIARGILSPFVWCLGRLRLVWPEALSSEANVARSRGVIAHELAHIRRGDHWVAWLELAASVVWWWNPLFWFVRRQLRETAEMACDALAIGADPESRREYAELLLEFSAGCKSGAPAPVLAVSTGTPSSFERRLCMILSDKVSGKVSLWGISLAMLFAVTALPGWSLGQQKPAPDKATAESARPALVDDPVLRELIEQGKFVEAKERLAQLRKKQAADKAIAEGVFPEKWREALLKDLPAACTKDLPKNAPLSWKACMSCHAGITGWKQDKAEFVLDLSIGLRHDKQPAGAALQDPLTSQRDPKYGMIVVNDFSSIGQEVLTSQRNLKHIALAFHQYHDSHGHLPNNSYSEGKRGLLSWRVHILPFIEQDHLYKQFRLHEPWDSEHNKKLIPRMPKLYAPIHAKAGAGETYYRGFAGKGAIFGPDSGTGIKFSSIVDGTSNTLLIVEAGEPTVWTKPDDLPFDRAKSLPKLGGLFGGMFNVALCDGSVQLLRKDANAEVMKRLIQYNDGEVLDFNKVRLVRGITVYTDAKEQQHAAAVAAEAKLPMSEYRAALMAEELRKAEQESAAVRRMYERALAIAPDGKVSRQELDRLVAQVKELNQIVERLRAAQGTPWTRRTVELKDRLYMIDVDVAAGVIVGANTKDGRVIWKLKIADSPADRSPEVQWSLQETKDGKLIVVTCERKDGRVQHTLDAATGKLIQSLNLANPVIPSVRPRSEKPQPPPTLPGVRKRETSSGTKVEEVEAMRAGLLTPFPNPVELGLRYLRGVEDLKKAQRRMAIIENGQGNVAVTQKALAEVQVELKLHEQHEKHLANLIKVAHQAAQAERANAEAEHRRAEELFKAGNISEAKRDYTKLALYEAETKVKQLKSILDLTTSRPITLLPAGTPSTGGLGMAIAQPSGVWWSQTPPFASITRGSTAAGSSTSSSTTHTAQATDHQNLAKRATALYASGKSREEVVALLFQAVLERAPTKAEADYCVQYLTTMPNDRTTAIDNIIFQLTFVKATKPK